MIVVDTNVVLDVLTKNPQWGPRSEMALRSLAPGDGLVGPVVYAELAVGYVDRAKLDTDIKRMGLVTANMSEDGLFAAGKAYAAYRQRGGPRASILPDFFIGAHAQSLGCPILTRDVSRFRTAFSDVPLIEP